MARKTKKPVDRTPICDAACRRRIDPLWMPGPVPKYFWWDETHRRDYLLWSADRLGFRTMEDFYRLELSICYMRNYGGGLSVYWGQSAIEALQDCFPDYDWKPWLFVVVPNGFWHSSANRQSYMQWLGQRLGYRRMDDWYEISIDNFRQNRGKGLITYYHASPVRAVIDLVPRQNWCEWKFRQLPPDFWETAKNRRRYLRWLGKELGFRRREDWYGIRAAEIGGRHGGGLLQRYSSLYDLMREHLPQLDWDRVDRRRPIPVEEVLAWADAHHARHGTWPTCESGEIPGTGGHTWRGIEACLRTGSRGLPDGSSVAKFLAKHRGVPIGRRPPPLSEEQILAWADAHFAAHGKWPNTESGPIPGASETWGAVAVALQVGCRGFRGGSTLAELLARARGVPTRRPLPPLDEEQILAWADACFAAQGKWPTIDSGPIAGTGETWGNVAKAMWTGGRGLRRRCSLAQLLTQRRGARNNKYLPPLKEEQILAWARATFKTTGRLPIACSAPIAQSPQETWQAVDTALKRGNRGLPGGSSLAKLLRKHGLK